MDRYTVTSYHNPTVNVGSVYIHVLHIITVKNTKIYANSAHSAIIAQMPNAPQNSEFQNIASYSLCPAKWVTVRSQSLRGGILVK